MPVMQLQGRRIRYTVVVRPRRRHAAIALAADGSFTVLLPRGMDVAEAERLLRQDRAWVLAHLKAPRSFGEGARVPVLGEAWSLAWVDHPGRTPGRVELPAGIADPRSALVAWYMDLATRVFGERLAHFAPRIGVDYGPLRIRDFKSRWGSCHSSGRIALNWRLVQAPASVVDYVVVHELCHRLVPHHGPAFYRQVESALPGWKSARRWLSAEGFRLDW